MRYLSEFGVWIGRNNMEILNMAPYGNQMLEIVPLHLLLFSIVYSFLPHMSNF